MKKGIKLFITILIILILILSICVTILYLKNNELLNQIEEKEEQYSIQEEKISKQEKEISKLEKQVKKLENETDSEKEESKTNTTNTKKSQSEKARIESARGSANDALSSALSSMATDIYTGRNNIQDENGETVTSINQITAETVKNYLENEMQNYDNFYIENDEENSLFIIEFSETKNSYQFRTTINKSSLTLRSIELIEQE